MYVTTFYSFKGGVGRSMALTNVAYELSRSGHRVLIVDFDLEAPGLDTFADVSAARPTKGIVEFVLDYLASDRPPDVMDYIFEAPDPTGAAGPIMIMPAGRPDDGYAARLGQIDWADLYENQDGYLLVEDLKAQWRERMEVDYVLIDSRTGHTDVAGICTRQLPDSVVVLFFPNDQNLRGLRKVVADIREEPHLSGRSPIETIFVASNVPYLDDEDEILRRRLSLFRRQLEYKQRLLLIHHYDSLALLDQPVFTRDRTETRLAKQYRALARQIQEANVQDRRGALSFLREPHLGSKLSAAEVDRLFSRLAAIENAHGSDGEVLFGLAGVYMNFGQIPQALLLLQDALRLGYSKPIVHLRLAEAYQRLAETKKASEAALRVFSDSSAPVDLLLRGTSLLRLTDANAVMAIADSPAITCLAIEDRVRFAATLDRSREEQKAGEAVLEPIVQRATGVEAWYGSAVHALGLAWIGLGQAQRAAKLFERQNERLAKQGEGARYRSTSTFNQTMAEWRMTGAPDPAAFRRFIDEFADSGYERNANHAQCFSLAYWYAGEEEHARAFLSKARQIISHQTAGEFSCWRYLRVSPVEFTRDLDEQEKLFSGHSVRPPFLGRSGTAHQQGDAGGTRWHD